MSNNQLHGKKFEDQLKSIFPGSSDKSRSVQSKWDIEAIYDKDGLPTSIKTTKDKSIGLADARNFFSLNESFRLLVGRYKQVDNQKIFQELYEYIITPEDLKKLKGNLLFEDVNFFHNEIRKFGAGKDNQILARKRVNELKNLLKNKINSSKITLNPKIDSKNQRRLQCSITIDRLNEIVKPTIYTEFYREFYIKIRILSSQRRFNNR